MHIFFICQILKFTCFRVAAHAPRVTRRDELSAPLIFLSSSTYVHRGTGLNPLEQLNPRAETTVPDAELYKNA